MDCLMTDERLSGLALIRTYTMTLTMTLTKSVQSLLPNTRGGCSKGQMTEDNVQPRLVGGAVGV